MKNIDMNIENDILTIKIDLSKDMGKSKTGRTDIVATTSGNIAVPQHPGVKLGINCYKER